jgi:hypothetical protein
MMRKILSFLVLLACGLDARAQVYNQFSPGGNLATPTATTCPGGTSTWNCQQLGAGAVTLAQQANLAANSIEANTTNSAAVPTAANPLAIANMQAAVIAAYAVSTSNIASLSGLPTIDGFAVPAGKTVLLIGQTTSSQNGLWIVASGAWTRPANFPTGYVIAANCEMLVRIEVGTVNQGFVWALFTNGTTTTIDTSSQTWSARNTKIPNATNSISGLVTVSGASSTVMSQGASGVTQFDCVDFSTIGVGAQTIGDDGNQAATTGPCIIGDPVGHPILNGNGTPPSVTGTGCSLSGGSQDATGAIVAAGIDTCTLTFGAAYTFHAPFCTVSGIGTTVLPTLSALPTTAHAIFVTAAAGTFTYHCF